MNKIKNFIKKKLVKVKKEKVVIPIIEGQYLSGRCALITGGSSGIGFAIADSFVKNGAKVVITGRDSNKLEKAKRDLIYKNKVKDDTVYTSQLNLCTVERITEALTEIINIPGITIDILVNNAGVNGGEMFPNTKVEDYDRILDSNLRGMYFVSQFIANYMVEKNVKGNILNVTSSSSLRPAISPYIVSKWGERGLTLGMAKKYQKHGIVVNAIAPGSTLTPMLNKNGSDDLTLNYAPSGRYLAPEEVANMATILVSDIGKMIIGDTIYMTGGAGLLTFDDMIY